MRTPTTLTMRPPCPRYLALRRCPGYMAIVDAFPIPMYIEAQAARGVSSTVRGVAAS